jgi:hypothetical protein
MAHRRPLIIAALLIAAIKCIQFAVDSQVLFYDDSGAFLLNALHYTFIPERSYTYSGLIRIFAVSTHSLRAIVAMQVAMGAITAWLLALVLLRYLAVRPWIAILAAVAFACDPVQIVHERLILAETTAMLAVALFLAAALEYVRTFDWKWLAAASFCGIALVSLRIVYVPVSLAAAIVLPIGAWLALPSNKRIPTALAVALAGSCCFTLLLHAGYQRLTGILAGREPAYHYRTGDFLISLVAPLVRAEDAQDARAAEAIRAQNRSDLPMSDIDGRARQMWTPEGIVARLRTAFAGDVSAAVRAGDQVGRAAILRDPMGFLRLGLHTYVEYWQKIPNMQRILAYEHGSPTDPVVPEPGVRMIQAEFGVNVSNQNILHTPSRRYHLFARYWSVFLLLSPLVAGLALWLKPAMSDAAATLFVWTLLLTGATFLGASEVSYRYLHPFSFTALATVAIVVNAWRNSRAPVISSAADVSKRVLAAR